MTLLCKRKGCAQMKHVGSFIFNRTWGWKCIFFNKPRKNIDKTCNFDFNMIDEPFVLFLALLMPAEGD